MFGWLYALEPSRIGRHRFSWQRTVPPATVSRSVSLSSKRKENSINTENSTRAERSDSRSTRYDGESDTPGLVGDSTRSPRVLHSPSRIVSCSLPLPRSLVLPYLLCRRERSLLLPPRVTRLTLVCAARRPPRTVPRYTREQPSLRLATRWIRFANYTPTTPRRDRMNDSRAVAPWTDTSAGVD